MSATRLSFLTLLVATMQTGFGAFVSVHLIAQGWHTGEIGCVLGASTIAAVISQVPLGMLIDRSRAKWGIAAVAIAAMMLALLVLTLTPRFWPVLAAQVLIGIAGPAFALALASITLAMTRRDGFGERIGRNARYAAIGAATGAGLLGLVGQAFSPAAVFVAAALFGAPAILVLSGLRGVGATTGRPRARQPASRTSTADGMSAADRRRLLALLACCVGFQLANTAMLPLAAADATRKAADLADMITAGATVVPQVLVALLSPWVGRLANLRGARFALLLGFAALPARALLFAYDGTPHLIVVWQALDGVSAAVFGVVLPLIVAEMTRTNGRFNSILGAIGVADALGAAASNAMAGVAADMLGLHATFLLLALAGLCATALVWLTMPAATPVPEARPLLRPVGALSPEPL